MDVIILIFACFALGFAVGWFSQPMIEALRNAGPPDTGPPDTGQAEPGELPPGVVPMDAVPELRKQPKTTTNVRKLQSHRAALMELCTARGLGAEARELIEDLDMEMGAK